MPKEGKKKREGKNPYSKKPDVQFWFGGSPIPTPQQNPELDHKDEITPETSVTGSSTVYNTPEPQTDRNTSQNGPDETPPQTHPVAGRRLQMSPAIHTFPPTTPVTDVRGIRRKLGETLQAMGHHTVGDLQKRMKKGFVDWLESVGAEAEEQEDIYNVVRRLDDAKGESNN
ncbi:uncharacterized protein LOC144927619 [Branchiostoma floridae x Branchiostoma belcheri]